MLADFATEYTLKPNGEYQKRDVPRIIRCRHYKGEIVDYKREMVLLYWPFQNEALDILDCNKFTEIYDQKEAQILSQRCKYETNLDINKTTVYCRQMCVEMDNEAKAQLKCETYLNMQKEDLNNDDFNMISDSMTSIVIKKKYCPVMSTVAR
jgi:hypothetical protein